MKKLLILAGGLFISGSVLKSQTPAITVKTTGYVSYETILDTYKSLDARDGELYYYPLKRVRERAGDWHDLNSRVSLQMISLQARLGFAITGPEIGTAKSSAVIESDFYGTDNAYVNLLRLRLAYLKLSWEKMELSLGQMAHPFVNADCTPSTLSFGAGVPYHTLNRDVQARLMFKPIPTLKYGIAALMQSTHPSVGPRDAQRKSGLPEVQFLLQVGSADKFLAGVTAGFKFLSPLDTTRLGFRTTKRTSSYALQGFARLTLAKAIFKYQLNYGTNLTNHSFIGGYAPKAGSEDINTSEIEFTNFKTLATWFDAETKFSKYNFGLFFGYSKNYGAVDDVDISTKYLQSIFYQRNADLDYIFRLAPRIFAKAGNLIYGIEYGLNGAAYGLEFNSKRKVTKTDDLVYNNRILLLVKYNF